MRIEITGNGLYGKAGKPIPVGTVLTVKEVPIGWKSRCRVLSGGEKGKTAVTNPKENPIPSGYEAKHRGGGSYSVMMGDEEVVSGLDKNQAERFNALSDEDKAAQVKGATAE